VTLGPSGRARNALGGIASGARASPDLRERKRRGRPVGGHTGAVKQSTELAVDADPALVTNVLADLSTYPHWNDLVQSVEPAEDGSTESPAWHTTLRAQVGPFSRSKQLRLVRTVNRLMASGRHLIRFERREHDERDHADWIMEAEIARTGDTAFVTLRLSYSGGLYTSLLDPILGSAIERASRRLPDYVNGSSDR